MIGNEEAMLDKSERMRFLAIHARFCIERQDSYISYQSYQ